MTDEHVDVLKPVPPELRPDVLRVWMCYRHLAGLESVMPLASLVASWVQLHRVPVPAVREALARVTAPRVTRDMRFAADVTAYLAEAISPRSNHGFAYDQLPPPPTTKPTIRLVPLKTTPERTIDPNNIEPATW